MTSQVCNGVSSEIFSGTTALASKRNDRVGIEGIQHEETRFAKQAALLQLFGSKKVEIA